LPGHDRPGGLPHSGEDALVVRRESGLLHARSAVRDQHHRLPAHLPGHRRGRGAFAGELFTHPLKNALGNSEFVPLVPYPRQLHGQLFFEFVQLCAPRAAR
jgi:hypothetical protein